MISEEDIDRVAKEVINRLIGEGIDVDKTKMVVGFNPNHQNYINTNDPWNPKPIYTNVRGYKVISIFSREMTNDRLDGNPLIYVLKGKDWQLKHPRYDILALLRRFVAVTKELNETFDTIITIPSSNSLNTEILHKIERIIPHENSFSDFFIKLTANDVYESFIDSEWLDRTYSDKDMRNKMHSRIYNALDRMCRSKSNGGNDGIFSYKFIKPIELRDAIKQSMRVSDEYQDEFSYA